MVSSPWIKFREWVARRRTRVAWDTLVLQAIPDQSLDDRVEWAENLMEWLSRDSPVSRLRLFFQLLDRQPEVRQRVARTLRSLVGTEGRRDALPYFYGRDLTKFQGVRWSGRDNQGVMGKGGGWIEIQTTKP